MYSNIWIAFVQIIAKKGSLLSNIIDLEDIIDESNGSLTIDNISGAWANVLIKAPTINLAIEIIPIGFDELGFDVSFIDKIENVGSLYEENELNEECMNDVKWLDMSEYKFKISGRIFPYGE